MSKAIPIPSLLTSREEIRAEIAEMLGDVFDRSIASANAIDGAYADLLGQTKRLVSRGGKRLRPMITVLSYEGYGGTNHQAILPVAVSQELFHTFILMQDDIIDGDDWRWGGLNISGYYNKRFKSSLPVSDARHFGSAWAMLGGDACLSMAIDIMLASSFPAKKVLRAIGYVNRTLFSIVGGELTDTALPLGLPGVDPDEARLVRVCQYKTAIYSFCTPLQLGALFAGSNQSILRKLEEFGVALGIAYQIRDDLLGMFGKQEEMGKPIISDLREGKQTLLIACLRQLSSPSQWKAVQACLGKTNATEEHLHKVRGILESSGARAKTENIAKKYAAQANKLLPDLGMSPEAMASLREFVEFAVARSY